MLDVCYVLCFSLGGKIGMQNGVNTDKEKLVDSSLRQSNIELLRIVIMLFITAHHFAVHSGFVFPTDVISFNRLWIQLIQIGGKIGVNIFVLISGFFLIYQKEIKMIKIIRLWGQVFFYSCIFYFVFVALGFEQFDTKQMISCIAPVTFSQWWFVSAYFVLYILAPYVNIFLLSLNHKQYTYFLTVVLLLWSVIPTFTGQTFQSNNLIWFFVLYTIGGYIRLFGTRIKSSRKKLIFIALICTALTFFSAVIFDILGTKMTAFAIHSTYFYDMQRLPMIIISVLIFIGFTKLTIGYSKVVNTISSTMFGVYLIHDNKFVRTYLWKVLLHSTTYSNSKMFAMYSLMVIALVFISCSIIELIRKKMEEKYMANCMNKISLWIDKKMNDIEPILSTLSK